MTGPEGAQVKQRGAAARQLYQQASPGVRARSGGRWLSTTLLHRLVHSAQSAMHSSHGAKHSTHSARADTTLAARL